MKKRILSFALVLLMLVLCCACSQTANNEEAKSVATAKASNKGTDNKTEETMESNIEETIPAMDISDVTDTELRGTLLHIDKINQMLGKKAYVSKEDFLKYHDVSITLLGDSISHLSTNALKKYFSNLIQNSVSGRELERGVEEFDNMKKAGRIGDIFAFSLATNASNGMKMDVFEHCYKGVEGKPFITFTTYFPYKGQVRNRNREIKKFVATHENCYLADWWDCVHDRTEDLIVEDGTHPSGLGSEVYAQLLFKTVVEAMKAQGK